MEIFSRAHFIILLIWCYQLIMQYEEMYEHHMRQCHLYDVVIRILRKQRYAARRFCGEEHALMCAHHGMLTVVLCRRWIRCTVFIHRQG